MLSWSFAGGRAGLQPDDGGRHDHPSKGLTYEPFGESGAVIRQRPEVRIRDAARMGYMVELGGSQSRWSAFVNYWSGTGDFHEKLRKI